MWETPKLSRQIPGSEVLRALLPPAQSSFEFEATIRQPVAYPALFPLQVALLPLDQLLRPTMIQEQQEVLPK